MEVSMQGECSAIGADGLIWNKLWKLHIPNKIKVFAGELSMTFFPLVKISLADTLWRISLVHCVRVERNQPSMHYGNVEWPRMFGR